jgi:adenylyltransferase/sulfurtransferase
MMHEKSFNERYACQLQLNDFGADAQMLLKESRVLVIGAGGLGCPILQYLTGAGVGCIGIVDHDVVELSNLHRQVLYTTEDIGNKKASTAAERLRKMNSEIEIRSYEMRITNQDALSILCDYDLVIDGSDNFATRFMINDACGILQKPLIYGAIGQTEGLVAIFHCKSNNITTNLRDLYPNLLPEEAAFSCKQTGTLGVVPGIIGVLMAGEAIKLMTGKGTPLSNQLMSYNIFTNQFHHFEIKPSTEINNKIPISEEAFLEMNYTHHLSDKQEWEEIDGTRLNELITDEKTLIIDIRDEYETTEITLQKLLRIPLAGLMDEKDKLQQADSIILICASGTRSKIGVKILNQLFGKSKKIYSLKGGILEWKGASKIFS